MLYASKHGFVYASTQENLFRRETSDNAWTLVDDPYQNHPVTALAENSISLFAAIDAPDGISALYRTAKPTIQWEELPIVKGRGIRALVIDSEDQLILADGHSVLVSKKRQYS